MRSPPLSVTRPPYVPVQITDSHEFPFSWVLIWLLIGETPERDKELDPGIAITKGMVHTLSNNLSLSSYTK